jgi:hypothetical protein
MYFLDPAMCRALNGTVDKFNKCRF